MNIRFENIKPPMPPYEIARLEESLLDVGCMKPLVVWGDTLIDGHKRYCICREHHIPYEVTHIHFNDDNEAVLWMIKEHFSQGTLSPFQRCELLMKFFPEMSLQDMADLAGVAKSAVLATGDILTYGSEDVIERVRAGSISIDRAYKSLRRTHE